MVRWKQGSKWGRQAAVAFNFRVYLTYGGGATYEGRILFFLWGKGAHLNVMSAHLREYESEMGEGGGQNNPIKFANVIFE